MSNTNLKAIVEGFIFASDKAMSVERILSLFPENEVPEKEDVENAIQELLKDYESHGIELNKVSTGYRFQVRQEVTPWVSRLWEEKPARYTRALLETLALIVYRQPITRGEIEEIRGVAVSSNIIKTLQEREWVRVVGHRDVPGKPALYASTKDFLDYFNLESLDQLPPLSDIKDLDTIITELDPDKNADLIEAINEMKESAKADEESAKNIEAQEPNEQAATAISDVENETDEVETEIDPVDAALAEIMAGENTDFSDEAEVDEFIENASEETEAYSDNENDEIESDSVEDEEPVAGKTSAKMHSDDIEYEHNNSEYEDGDSLISDEETSHS